MVDIQKEIINNVLVVTLGAEVNEEQITTDVELDIDNNYILTEAIEEELGKGQTKFLLNLKNVSYIDSSGLGAIFDGYKQVEEKNGVLKILNPSSDVKRVLDITKISQRIKIFFNEKEAIENF